MITIYELAWGSADIAPQRRYFRPYEGNDAMTRLAEKIVELDKAPARTAFVRLFRLPDFAYPEGIVLVAWTKTSAERPTSEGELPVDYFTREGI